MNSFEAKEFVSKIEDFYTELEDKFIKYAEVRAEMYNKQLDSKTWPYLYKSIINTTVSYEIDPNGFTDDHYTIKVTEMWACDKTQSYQIPWEILDDFNSWTSKFKKNREIQLDLMYESAYKNKCIEEERQREIEYETYLKLKEKFEKKD